MALPASGPLSLFAIFKEIYGREPNIGERVSFHDLVNRSNLADKSFPCPFSRFYGYRHTVGLIGNTITLTLTKEDSQTWQVDAAALYPVASQVTIEAEYLADISAESVSVVITIMQGNLGGSTTVSVSPLTTSLKFVSATCNPPQDDTYKYIAQG